MEEYKEKSLGDLLKDAKLYIDTRIKHLQLSSIEKGSKIFADLITNGVVAICFILAFLFGTFTLALYLSDVFGSYTQGFGCVAGIYLLLALIFLFTKDKFIEPRLVNLFIRKYFEKVADNDDEDESE